VWDSVVNFVLARPVRVVHAGVFEGVVRGVVRGEEKWGVWVKRQLKGGRCCICA
jgi:hypothetical protein